MIERIDTNCPTCNSPGHCIDEIASLEERIEEKWMCNKCPQKYIVTFAVIPITKEVIKEK